MIPANPIICLVDDDPSVLRSLERLLTLEGYAVLLFRDPIDFVKHAAGHPVTLAILDFVMPGLSGRQVQECLRSLSPDTRVIMLSAAGDRDLRIAVMENGAHAFLDKPCRDEELLAAVRDALV